MSRRENRRTCQMLQGSPRFIAKPAGFGGDSSGRVPTVTITSRNSIMMAMRGMLVLTNRGVGTVSRKFSRALLTLGIMAAVSNSAVDAQSFSMAIDPRATYLQTGSVGNLPPQGFDLQALGIVPGDLINVTATDSTGAVTTWSGGPSLLAVFSSANCNPIVLPASNRNRLPCAIQAGTQWPSRVSDIPEDFTIVGLDVEVPPNARYLFFTANAGCFSAGCANSFTVTITRSASQFGNCLQADAPSSGELIASNVDFDSSQISVEAWVNVDHFFADHGEVAVYTGQNGSPWLLKLVDKGNQQVGVEWTVGSITTASSAVFMRDSWHHVAGTFDGSQLRVYVDGQPVASRAAAIPIPGAGASRRLNAVVKMSAYIDELRVWSTARSQDEIQCWLRRTLSTSQLAMPALLAYWKLDDLLWGSIAPDASSHHFNGIVYSPRALSGAIYGSGPDVTIAGPLPQTVPCSGTATLTVAPSGCGPYAYQWQYQSDVGSWYDVPPTSRFVGTTQPTMTIVNVGASDMTLYRCRVTHALGTAYSQTALLTVLSVSTPTSASVNRNNLCAEDGGTVTLSAAGGFGTNLFWYPYACEGVPPIGSGTSLTIPSPESTTTYFARWATGPGDVCVSGCASVTVNVIQAPTTPIRATVDRERFCGGDPGTITLTAQGGSGTNLFWYPYACDGMPPIGQGVSLTIPSPDSTTTYYARWTTGPVGVCESSCVQVTVHVCRADMNCSGSLSVQDIFDFLSAYFAGLPDGDFNRLGGISVQDIFDFLSAYFAGCL